MVAREVTDISEQLAGGMYAAPTDVGEYPFARQCFSAEGGTGMPVPYEGMSYAYNRGTGAGGHIGPPLPKQDG